MRVPYKRSKKSSFTELLSKWDMLHITARKILKTTTEMASAAKVNNCQEVICSVTTNSYISMCGIGRVI